MSTDLPGRCAVSASVNAWPVAPTPGGSLVPRAKTTSTSEQGSAAATLPVMAGVNTDAASATATIHQRIARAVGRHHGVVPLPDVLVAMWVLSSNGYGAQPA